MLLARCIPTYVGILYYYRAVHLINDTQTIVSRYII